MLEKLKREVCEANLKLVAEGLVIRTWGNASGIDRAGGRMVIKPSGVPYSKMKPAHMVVVDMDSGRTMEGKLNPSSDTATHLALYRAFKEIGGVVHTHSLYATIWAQAQRAIPALGTTHADYFHGPVPCTRLLSEAELRSDYEASTGQLIVATIGKRDPLACPGILVASHAPFAWGRSLGEAVENAVVLEHVARMALETLRLNQAVPSMQDELLNKHFLRKHGPQATYGQKRRA